MSTYFNRYLLLIKLRRIKSRIIMNHIHMIIILPFWQARLIK